jgi:MEMO1 family protein
MVRPAAVAGQFYPDDPAKLRALVEAYLGRAGRCDERPAPKALIAPHAGYIYSGPVAASAYASLHTAAHRISRVVLIGPSHFVTLRGFALSSAAAFTTPLGEVPVDRAAAKELARNPLVVIHDGAHRHEHALEVHLPFLQILLPRVAILPLLAGEATCAEMAEIIEALWGGPETLILISSDLSHYYDYAMARRLDERTAEAIEAIRPEDIGAEQACGRIPIGGLLRLARAKRLGARRVDLRNSADTAGVGGEVVGYGAFLFA